MIQQQIDGQICCASYHVGDIKIQARLLERHAGVQKHYSIELCQADERTVCELGSDFLRARGIFLDVVFGGVTACTLQDVVEDRMGTLF